MNPWLFTTPWGALYLVVLLFLMTPALWWENRRWLAMSMFLLFGLDRVSVNLLSPMLALYFLAFAYTAVAVAVTVTHSGRAAKIIGAALTTTSVAFIAGGFGLIDWDITGTIQEICGLIAMLSIIWRRHDGAGLIQPLDGRVARHRPDLAGSVAERRQARK
jgi:hypothetical protein